MPNTADKYILPRRGLKRPGVSYLFSETTSQKHAKCLRKLISLITLDSMEEAVNQIFPIESRVTRDMRAAQIRSTYPIGLNRDITDVDWDTPVSVVSRLAERMISVTRAGRKRSIPVRIDVDGYRSGGWLVFVVTTEPVAVAGKQARLCLGRFCVSMRTRQFSYRDLLLSLLCGIISNMQAIAQDMKIQIRMFAEQENRLLSLVES